MMLCLDEQFHSLKILRQPQEGVGAGLVFVDIYFFSYKTKQNKIPAMDPKHLINTYLCVFYLSALVFMSASAIL